MQPLEEGLKEVCIIDTIMEEQAEQQEVLIEELSFLSEELQESQEICVLHRPWRKKRKKFYLY